MEDYKLILYIIAIVAYFLFTAWRKAFNTPDEKEQVKPKPQDRPQRERPSPRSMPASPPPPVPDRRQHQRPTAPATSFDDILKEMQSKMDKAQDQERRADERVREAYKPATKPVSYERAPARALSLEVPEQARQYDKKLKMRREAIPEAPSRPKQQQKQPSIYAQMLRDPQTVRQAFIFSEIFNRKQY